MRLEVNPYCSWQVPHCITGLLRERPLLTQKCTGLAYCQNRNMCQILTTTRSAYSCAPTSPSKSMANRLPFRLLDLPAELRECIYEHVFGGTIIAVQRLRNDEDPTLSKYHATSPPCNTNSRFDPPALLLTSKQLHSEAIRVFYRTAIFSFFWDNNIVEWYTGLPPYLRDAVTNIYQDRTWWLKAGPVTGFKDKIDIQESLFRKYTGLELLGLDGRARPGVVKVCVVLRSGEVVWTNDPRAILQAEGKEASDEE